MPFGAGAISLCVLSFELKTSCCTAEMRIKYISFFICWVLPFSLQLGLLLQLRQLLSATGEPRQQYDRPPFVSFAFFPSLSRGSLVLEAEPFSATAAGGGAVAAADAAAEWYAYVYYFSICTIENNTDRDEAPSLRAPRIVIHQGSQQRHQRWRASRLPYGGCSSSSGV